MTTRKVLEGEPLEFDKPAMLLECCGCGLNHLVVLVERDGMPMLKYYRDDYETEKARIEDTDKAQGGL